MHSSARLRPVTRFWPGVRLCCIPWRKYEELMKEARLFYPLKSAVDLQTSARPPLALPSLIRA